MTKQEAIVAAPSTRGRYATTIFVDIALVGGMVAAVQVRHVPLGWLLTALSPFALLHAIQAAHRLIHPVHAARASLWIASYSRERIWSYGLWVRRSLILAVFILIALQLTLRRPWIGVATALLSYINVSFMLGLQDFMGVPLQDDAEDYEHSPPLTHLKPLVSSEWGMGSSHQITP